MQPVLEVLQASVARSAPAKRVGSEAAQCAQSILTQPKCTSSVKDNDLFILSTILFPLFVVDTFSVSDIDT